MSRSSWKYKFVDNDLLKLKTILIDEKENEVNSSNPEIIYKTLSRRSTILEDFVNLNIHIYNGFTYKKLLIKENMVGQKFGEFFYTRKFPKHKNKNKK
jgi:small subunit ribosomal protein S19